MVHFLLGRNGYGKTSAVLSAISARADAGEKNMLLIVPETVSHTTERSLCAHAGNRISLHAEVTTFSRLCELVSSLSGRRSDSLDAGGRILLLSRAMRQAEGSLELLRGGMRPELLSELLSLEEECRVSNITPEMLWSASEQFTPPLSKKLRDLSVIFAAYEGALCETGTDAADRLQALAEDAARLQFFADREIWVDGFSGFSEVELDVLRLVFRQAKDVTVTLCADLSDPSPAFLKPNRVYETLKRICGTCRTEVLTEPYRFTSPALSHLEQNLFAEASAPTDETDGIEFYRAHSRFEECELAAAKILELVREKGYRFREIGITARDFGAYSETLESVFSYYDIPVYLNHKSDLIEKPVIALTCAALACIENRFRYEDMLKLLKSGLSGLSKRAADELERYLYLWEIHGKDWSENKPFTRSPNGMSRGEDDEAELFRLNLARKKILTPLLNLKKAIAEDKTGLGFSRALICYYEEINLPRRLRARSKLFLKRGDLQRADEYRQFWDILCRVLESIGTALRDTRYELRDLNRLFTLTVSQYEVASIPISLDRVHAGGVDRLGEQAPRCLILLGCNDGELPMRLTDAGPLSDSDRARLESCGLHLAKNSAYQTEDEFHLIYRAFSLAREHLILSCHEEETLPSVFYTQAQALFPKCEIKQVSDTVRSYAKAPALDAAMSRDASFSDLARAYFHTTEDESLLALAASRAHLRRGPLKSPKLRDAMFGRNLCMSASKLDTFERCRFQYFLHYGLGLKPTQVATLDAPNKGTLVHWVLEHAIKEITEKGASSFTRDEVYNIARRLANEYTETVLGGLSQYSARFAAAFSRIRRAACNAVCDLHEELLTSKFTPVDFELKFGPYGEIPSMEIRLDDGSSLTLQGVVDRVDAFAKDGCVYLRILDYKTGHKTFSIPEVINGIGMQMLLYLFALEEFGEMRYHAKIRPAGVLYIMVNDDTSKFDSHPNPENSGKGIDDLRKHKGLLVDDEALLENSKFLPISYNKNGTMSSRSSVAPLAMFYLLRDRMMDILHTVGDEIRAGNIDANPYYANKTQTSCDWCQFRAVCGFEPGVAGDKLRYLFTTKIEDLKGGDDRGGDSLDSPAASGD